MTRGTESAQRRRLGWLLLIALGGAACTQEEAPRGRPGFVGDSSGPPSAAGGDDAQDPTQRIAYLQSQLAQARARAEQAESRAAELRADAAAAEEKRVAREREWLEYSQLLSMVSPERLPGGKPFEAELPPAEALPVPAAEAARPPVDPAILGRSGAIARSLATLFTLEQVRGMDILECGILDGDAIGPAVFRLLDGQGRLCGGLYAERLRMEGSRAARTLTLVLEGGYEMRAGERLPFDTSAAVPGRPDTRRIVLGPVDPTAWADDFRELFGEHGLDLSGDDGLWDLVQVKQKLNEQLKTQTGGGVYRLRELGGVQDGVLIAVHLERLDESGEVERRLFADRMHILRSAGGVELLLESGVQVRGEDQRVPFLDGRYRILFPTADAAVWARAELPGLAVAPGSESAPKPAAADLPARPVRDPA